MSSPRSSPAARALARARGYTLIEMVVVLVITGILSALVVNKALGGTRTRALQAADTLANDLRRTRLLAMGTGRSLTLAATSGSYAVSCSGGGTTPPCKGTGAIDDPARGGRFSVTLESGITLGPASVNYDAAGRPGAATSFTVSANGNAVARLDVAAVTGYVSLVAL